MAKVYIAGQYGDNANAGTQGSPWADFTNLATESAWDQAYVMRGAEFNAAAATKIQVTSDKLISVYGDSDSPLPIIDSYVTFPSEGWTEVSAADLTTPASGTNLWSYSNSTLVYAPIRWVNFGALGTHGEQMYTWDPFNGDEFKTEYVPSSDRQFAVRNGSAAEDARIIIYSVGNPVSYYGIIYYQEETINALIIKDVSNVTVEQLAFRYGNRLAKFVTVSGTDMTNIKLRNCTMQHGFSLVQMWGEDATSFIDGFEITGNVCNDVLGNPIIPTKYIKNGLIQHNQLDNVGLTNSAGGIYIGDCYATAGNEIHICQNSIKRQGFGNYWINDGGSIMTDTDCSNIWVYRNYMEDSHAGLISNSGQSGLRYWSNICVNVDQPFHDGDTDGTDNVDSIYANNTNIQTQMSPHNPSRIAPGAMRFKTGSGVAVPTSTCTMVNNICMMIENGQTNAFSTTVEGLAEGSLIESNNILFGHTIGFNVNSTEQGLDASDQVVELSIDSDYRTSDSETQGAGIDWWTADGMSKPRDYYGRMMLDTPDIGAVVSSYTDSKSYVDAGLDDT